MAHTKVSRTTPKAFISKSLEFLKKLEKQTSIKAVKILGYDPCTEDDEIYSGDSDQEGEDSIKLDNFQENKKNDYFSSPDGEQTRLTSKNGDISQEATAETRDIEQGQMVSRLMNVEKKYGVISDLYDEIDDIQSKHSGYIDDMTDFLENSEKKTK